MNEFIVRKALRTTLAHCNSSINVNSCYHLLIIIIIIIVIIFIYCERHHLTQGDCPRANKGRRQKDINVHSWGGGLFAEWPFYTVFALCESAGRTGRTGFVPGPIQDSTPGRAGQGNVRTGRLTPRRRDLGSLSFWVGGGRGRSAGFPGRSWGRSVGSERPVRREGSGRAGAAASEAREGVRGAVPGVELLAVGERPHVVVAHEVAAAHGARALVGHGAPLNLQLRVEAQARHGRRLPGHPEQQQQQRRRRGPPAPGPERHRGRRGEQRGAGAGAGRDAEPARACGARAARVGAGRAAALCKRGKDSRPSPGGSHHPLSHPPPPGHIRARGGAAAARQGWPAAPRAARAQPGPALPCPALRAGPPRKRAGNFRGNLSSREKS